MLFFTNSFESAKGCEKMYKIVTKEDTIRIPAEYMRKGQSLDQHIDRLSMTAFEGRFDDDNRFVDVTSLGLELVHSATAALVTVID